MHAVSCTSIRANLLSELLIFTLLNLFELPYALPTLSMFLVCCLNCFLLLLLLQSILSRPMLNCTMMRAGEIVLL